MTAQYRGKEVEPITPNDKFYIVIKNVVDPKVDPALTTRDRRAW